MKVQIPSKESERINTSLIYHLTSLFWTKEPFEEQLELFCKYLGAFFEADQVRVFWTVPYFKTIESWSVNENIKKSFENCVDDRWFDEHFYFKVNKKGYFVDSLFQSATEIKAQECHSNNMFLLPVQFNKDHLGFISIEHFKGHKTYTEDEVETLLRISDFFNAIISKQYAINDLKQQKNHFEVLATSVDEGMIVVKDGEIIEVNDMAVQMFGYDLGEFKQLKGVDDILEAGFQWIEETISDLNNNVYETRGINVSEQFFPIEVKGKKVVNNFESLYVLTLKDLSLLRRFERELRESERRWQFAVDGSGLGLWDWDAVTNEVFFSKQWKKMLGFKDHEIQGSYEEWDKRVHPNDKERVYADLNKHFEGETEHYINEHRVLCKDGSYKWILDRGRVMSYTLDGKPKRVIGTHYDITERKESIFQLNRLNATKDKMFSIISHDLRGPIWASVQLSEQLERDNYDTKEEKVKAIQSLKELTHNTYDLLENLLSWARFNQDEIQFQPREVDLKEIIEKNIIQSQYQLDAKRIKTTVHFSSKKKANADYNMVNLCVRNILGNAVKFTNKNGEINFDVSDQNGEMFVRITDSGVGIKKEDINKILSESNYHTTWGTDNEKGAGLGMKLCKSFINKCQGILFIESEEGKGTTFGFTLPVLKKVIVNLGLPPF